MTASGLERLSAGRLRLRLFFYIAAAMLLLALALGALVFVSTSKHIEEDWSRSLSHSAEIRSLALGEWCRRSKDVAGQITTRTRMREELGRYVDGEVSQAELHAFTRPKFQDAMRRSPYILGILRLDNEEHVVTHAGTAPEPGTIDFSSLVADEALLSAPLELDGHRALVVSAPIISRAGRRLGTDLVLVSIEKLEAVIADPGEEAEGSVVGVGYAKGDGVAPVFLLRDESAAAGSKAIDFAALSPHLVSGLAGAHSVRSDEELCVAYQPVEACGWSLAVARDRGALAAFLDGELLDMAGVSFLVYVVVLLGFWFATAPLAGRILMHNDELEHEIRDKTALLVEEVAERRKAQEEREATIVELRAAMDEIKVLGGMLPICSHCKKIRDDQGYWKRLESYISEHSGAEFSHGICPDCARTYYPELNEEDEEA